MPQPGVNQPFGCAFRVKRGREVAFLAETIVRKFQSFRNPWTVLATNEEEQQKFNWT